VWRVTNSGGIRERGETEKSTHLQGLKDEKKGRLTARLSRQEEGVSKAHFGEVGGKKRGDPPTNVWGKMGPTVPQRRRGDLTPVQTKCEKGAHPHQNTKGNPAPESYVAVV